MTRDSNGILLDIERISETLDTLYNELEEYWHPWKQKILLTYKWQDKIQDKKWEWSVLLNERSAREIARFESNMRKEWKRIAIQNIFDLI